MAPSQYSVERVTQTIYLDNNNQAVNGFTLHVLLLEYGETLDINVPTADPEQAKKVIKQYLENRRKLKEMAE